MTIAAGTITQNAVSSTTVTLTITQASGGTGPYTTQWYRSTVSGFSPGGGNIIAGATSLVLTDTGLIPNTGYYYKAVQTDTGHSNDTATSAQSAVQTSVPTLSQNQFAQRPYVGVPDEKINPNTLPVQIDASQATPLYCGAFVKLVDSAGGVPKVVGLADETDEVFGVLNYSFINVNFAAGHAAEMSAKMNVIYLYATAPIARGQQVTPDLSTNGGVKPVTGSSGDTIVGWAYDKAVAAGDLIRVFLETPSFLVDA